MRFLLALTVLALATSLVESTEKTMATAFKAGKSSKSAKHGKAGSKECLASNKQVLPEDLPVDCHDMPTSLDNILVHLLGEGSSFGGNVFTAADGELYKNATRQFASARVTTAPSFIVEAMNQADVQAVVVFASTCGHKVTARSGGHSFVGSSSCDGNITSCIQLDVGNLNHVHVALPQVHVGPGVKLEQLYPVLIDNNVFIPAGEGGGVGVGGHGGFGNWMRQFGRFNSFVSAFDIVLSDGSLATVTHPKDGVTSRFNDDLWHAFLGGASGSFGVAVDITFTPIDESEYTAFFWSVLFLHADHTKQCIRNMLEEYATMLGEEDFKSDDRWTIFFNIFGHKALLAQTLSPLAFNYVQLEFTWVAPSTSDKSQAYADANAIYQRLLTAYKSGGHPACVTLDEYFDQLPDASLSALFKGRFPSHYALATDSKSLSELHNDVALVNWKRLGLEAAGVPFKTSYQQGPRFPTAAELLELFDRIDALVPVDPVADPRFLISQIVTGEFHSDDKVAQPFQNDVFGVALNIWGLDGADYGHDLREIQDFVIQSFDGEDHRMFWGAYEDTCLECGAWEKYYESRLAFNKLTQTKRCVDPNNLFKFRMSMPTTPVNENLF